MCEEEFELLLSRFSQDIAYMGLRIQRDVTKFRDKLNSTHKLSTFCNQLADILKKNSEYISQFSENLEDKIKECNQEEKYSEALYKLKSIHRYNDQDKNECDNRNGGKSTENKVITSHGDNAQQECEKDNDSMIDNSNAHPETDDATAQNHSAILVHSVVNIKPNITQDPTANQLQCVTQQEIETKKEQTDIDKFDVMTIANSPPHISDVDTDEDENNSIWDYFFRQVEVKEELEETLANTDEKRERNGCGGRENMNGEDSNDTLENEIDDNRCIEAEEPAHSPVSTENSRGCDDNSNDTLIDEIDKNQSPKVHLPFNKESDNNDDNCGSSKDVVHSPLHKPENLEGVSDNVIDVESNLTEDGNSSFSAASTVSMIMNMNKVDEDNEKLNNCDAVVNNQNNSNCNVVENTEDLTEEYSVNLLSDGITFDGICAEKKKNKQFRFCNKQKEILIKIIKDFYDKKVIKLAENKKKRKLTCEIKPFCNNDVPVKIKRLLNGIDTSSENGKQIDQIKANHKQMEISDLVEILNDKEKLDKSLNKKNGVALPQLTQLESKQLIHILNDCINSKLKQTCDCSMEHDEIISVEDIDEQILLDLIGNSAECRVANQSDSAPSPFSDENTAEVKSPSIDKENSGEEVMDSILSNNENSDSTYIPFNTENISEPMDLIPTQNDHSYSAQPPSEVISVPKTNNTVPSSDTLNNDDLLKKNATSSSSSTIMSFSMIANTEKMDEAQTTLTESYFCKISREEIVDVNTLKQLSESPNSDSNREHENAMKIRELLLSDDSLLSDDDSNSGSTVISLNDKLNSTRRNSRRSSYTDLKEKYSIVKDLVVNVEEMILSPDELKKIHNNHNNKSDSETDIDKLCDIDTILRKRTKTGDTTETRNGLRKKKRRKIFRINSKSSSYSSDSISETELLDNNLKTAITSADQAIQSVNDDNNYFQNDFLNNLIQNVRNSSDESQKNDNNNSSSDFNWSSDEDAETGSKRKLKKANDESKQDKKMPRMGSSITVHSSDSDLEIVNKSITNKKDGSKKKWRQHPLLVIDTSDDSSNDGNKKKKKDKDDNDTDDDDDKKNKKKAAALKRFEMKCLAQSNENNMNDNSKRLDKKPKEWDIIISSEDEDSDIEFLSTNPGSTTNNAESASQKGKGRRNIRALVEDTDLEASTRRAKEEEEIRIKRLHERQKNKGQYSMSMTELSKSFNNSQENAAVDYENPLILDLNENIELRVNDDITRKLKDHQRNGIQFMWDSCYESIEQINKNWEGSGCILAHCMGLGKTLQALTFIQTLFKYTEITKIKNAAVICPLSVVSNWKKEYQIMMNKVKERRMFIYTIESKMNSIKRINIVRKWNEKGGLLILGYEAFRSLTTEEKLNNWEGQQYCRKSELIEALIDPGPDLIVCDEGHLLRNKQTARNVTLNRIKTKRKIILTGTPLQNNLLEYYCMVHLVKPNLLGTEKEFKTNFVNPINNGQYEDSTEIDILLMKQRTHVLHKILNKTVQRVEVTELHKYLPKIIDQALFFSLTELQIKFYNTYLDYQISNDDYIRNGAINSRRFLADVQVLNLVCTHPYLIALVPSNVIDNKNEDATTTTHKNNWCKELLTNTNLNQLEYGTKITFLIGLLNEVAVENEKALIFSQSYAEMDALEYFLIKHLEFKKNINYFRMDGTTLPDERTIMCDKFNDPTNINMKVFIMSTKVGGLGLNLTAANRVIIMSVHWNPSYDVQSIFRTYRFGQKKTVYVYRLVAMNTMEEKRYQRQVTKLAIAHRVIDKHQITRHYNSNDIQAMYSIRPLIVEDRPLTKVPEDKVLAKLFQKYRFLHKWHEHQALLENRPEEDLDEQQKNAAWEEFNKQLNEHEARQQIPVVYHPFTSSATTAPNTTLSASINLPDVLERPNVPLINIESTLYDVRSNSVNDFESHLSTSTAVHAFSNHLVFGPIQNDNHQKLSMVNQNQRRIDNNKPTTPQKTYGKVVIKAKSVSNSFVNASSYNITEKGLKVLNGNHIKRVVASPSSSTVTSSTKRQQTSNQIQLPRNINQSPKKNLDQLAYSSNGGRANQLFRVIINDDDETQNIQRGTNKNSSFLTQRMLLKYNDTTITSVNSNKRENKQ